MIQAASRYLVLEMQPKNYPAIQMAQKLGLDFADIMTAIMPIMISPCSLPNRCADPEINRSAPARTCRGGCGKPRRSRSKVLSIVVGSMI